MSKILVFLALISMALVGCGVTDRVADRWAQADTEAQRAFRLVIVAAPLINYVYNSVPRLRDEACKSAVNLMDIPHLAEMGGLALATGIASNVILTYGGEIVAGASGIVPRMSRAVVIANVLSNTPELSLRVKVGKSMLNELVATGQNPTPAHWDQALASVNSLECQYPIRRRGS